MTDLYRCVRKQQIRQDMSDTGSGVLYTNLLDCKPLALTVSLCCWLMQPPAGCGWWHRLGSATPIRHVVMHCHEGRQLIITIKIM